jgi:hypothetical protein
MKQGMVEHAMLLWGTGDRITIVPTEAIGFLSCARRIHKWQINPTTQGLRLRVFHESDADLRHCVDRSLFLIVNAEQGRVTDQFQPLLPPIVERSMAMSELH